MGSAAKDILKRAGDVVQNAADDILMPIMDSLTKDTMTDEEKHKARRDDPEFRKADDEYQKRTRDRERRKAKGKGEDYP